MARTGKTPSGLARNLMMLVLASVAGALVLVGGAALTGVYGYTRSVADARLEEYLNLAVVQLEAVGRGSTLAIDRAASFRGTGTVDPDSIIVDYSTSSEFLDRIVVLDRSGAVEVAYPTFARLEVPAQVSAAAKAVSSTTTFLLVRDAKGDPWLWGIRGVAWGTGHVVAGRIRLERTFQVFSSIASSEGRGLVVVDDEGRAVMSAGSVPADLTEAAFTPGTGEGAVGTVELGAGEASAYTGRYADAGLPGLDWRVVVIEPHNIVVRDTWMSLLPGALALVLLGSVMAVAVYVAAGRILGPLRELQNRSHKAMDGAFVRPLPVVSDDEVGQVTRSFNALILRLNALHDVTDLMAGAAHTEQVLDATLAALRHIVPSARAAVFLLDPSRSHLVLERTSDPAGGEGVAFGVETRLWLVDGASGQGPSCPTKLARAEEWAALGPIAQGGPGGGLVVPLAYGPERVGAIVMYQQSRELTDAEIETVRTFAGQVAVAIRTSRLFELEHASRREAEVLRAVAEQLANPASLAEALHVVVALSGTLLGTARSGVDIRDREDFGLGEEPDGGDWLALWDGLSSIGQASVEAPVVIEDVSEVPLAAAWAVERDVERVVLVPLGQDGDVIGVLAFEYERVGDPITEDRKMLASAIGKQLSLALENASLFEQARSRAESLETVFRITQTVSSSLQTKVVLNRVLDVVQKIFLADAVSLMTYEPARKALVTAMARGLVSQEMLYLETARDQDIPGRVFETQQPVRVGSLSATSQDHLERAAVAQGLVSLMSVPLLARGRSIGAITVLSGIHDAFTSADMELLLTLASQAALAIDAAQMYGREHAVASTLQQSLLPGHIPDLPGFTVASEYRAAATEAEIGGDYYDVFFAPNGRAVLVMGDVCGKGIAAATKTSMIKYVVRGLVAAGKSPAEVLSTLNGMVKSERGSMEIVTVWLGMLDMVSGSLVYANAGHPPALLLDPTSAEIERLDPTGPLLGAIAAAPFEERWIDVPEGATLMLYTDGVTEARKGNRFFGEGRVRRALKTRAEVSGVLTALMQALEAFSPDGLRDDVAVLVVRRAAPEPPSDELEV